MLLWMVGWRIGSAIIRSRKTNIVCVRVYFWRRFSPFLGNSRADDHPPTEKPVEGNDTWIQEEKWEQSLLQISNSVSTLCGYERIKNVWAWPGGMWLDITLYTHSIFLSWDIACNPCQYNTVLIQSLMHLSDSLIPAGQVQIARTIFLLVVWIPAV